MAYPTHYVVYNLHSFTHAVPSDQRDPSLIVESSPIHFSRIISDISADIKNFCLNYRATIGTLSLFAHSTMLHTIKLMSHNINIICSYMSLYMIKVPQEKKNCILLSVHHQYLLLYLSCSTHLKNGLNYC